MKLHIGDCIEAMRQMADASVDSIVTDPPYGLGFMGKKWDVGVPAVDVFVECLRVLKPGGHLVAFGGSRTYHRLAVAVEDAGFEIRDQIMWLYGSGFPKSRNVGKEVEGFEGWGTALKPAHEPIVLARKPLTGTVAATVTEHGTGALNVDGCRVETTDDLNGGAYAKNGGRSESQSLHGGSGMNQPGKTAGREFAQPEGRWPANVAHDGSDEVLEAFPDAKGPQGALTGNEPSGKMGSANCYGRMDRRHVAKPRVEVDRSAARFFYCAKASKADRGEANNHPTVKPTELMRWLCRLVTPPGGVVLDPFMGSGSTGKAAVLEGFRFVGIEKEPEYAAIAEARIARELIGDLL